MLEIVKCNEADYETYAGIWERSVLATHSFLRVEDFNEIKTVLIPDYFPNPDTIEMLFIDSDRRGQGYGSALVEFAKREGATKVDVYEQNPSALNFYKVKGFRIISRDETDDVGRPYPIQHLSL